MIKYAFARCNNEVLHINEVTPGIRANSHFHCVICDERMTAHLRGKRRKHFQHLSGVDHDFESYLHKAAIDIIEAQYIKALANKIPVFLEYYENRICNRYVNDIGYNCNHGDCITGKSLIDEYKIVTKEKHGNFFPDIAFKTHEGDIIFIEVLVTHACSSEKLNSGIKIIEIKISNEDDLLMLKNLSFKLSNPNMKFHNFDKPIVTATRCSEDVPCSKKSALGIFYKDGSYTIELATMKNIASLKGLPVVSRFVALPYDEKGTGYHFHKRALAALEQKAGWIIKSCVSCKYHKPCPYTPATNKDINCLKFGARAPETAIKCEHFSP